MNKRALIAILVVMAMVTAAVPTTTPAAQAQGGSLVFWSTETQPERAAKTLEIIENFTAETGIEVNLVLTDENTLDSLMAANLAAGTLPDVVFHPVDFTASWYAQGILDAEAATTVIEDLGEETFSALNLVGVEDGMYAAVPTDGWGQLLVYRADLFAEAGLEPPTTFELIETAAAALNDPENDFYGITSATDESEVFMQQTFEHFALANGVELTDDDGNVTLDTAAMAEALDFYGNLLANYGPPGACGVVCTRATYFAGQAGMIVWSPFILDEMAGLRDAALPNCPECEDNIAYLAENSGIVPAFVGPSGSEPAQYGQVSNMGISTTADTDAAIEFVEFWLSDGYLDWLSTSPEGKFPMHRGTPDEPTLYIDGWSQLETGVDRRAPLGDYYGEEVLQILIEGATGFNRWGFAKGQGQLVSGVYSELPVPTLLRDVLDGNLDGAGAASEIQIWVEDIQAALEE
ncbi:MAG: extracellular solute-binding protein [Chloroflexi bacterium]|nr:extracellular solute-binding protein [Chloroflexota bacterium]